MKTGSCLMISGVCGMRKMLRAGSYFVFLLMPLLTAVQGCNRHETTDDSDGTPGNVDGQYKEVNDWILENMEVYYYWNTAIPASADTRLKPDEYFESLLYAGDRFSYIQDNFFKFLESMSGVTTEAGYAFTLLRMSASSADVVGLITYIKPGTPAETAGLKRGDWFLTVNSEQLTVNNYVDLLERTASVHTLGMADISANGTITGTHNVPLEVMVYSEHPILLDTVYTIQDRKIGYFVYNFFARDSEDYGIAYEKDLNNVFWKFKLEEIDELIVDLRYNGGGTVITAAALASMISGRSADDVLGYEEYNSILDTYYLRELGKGYNVTYFPDYIERTDQNGRVVEQVEINRLTGLGRVYLIVSDQTASASELIINCLRPYMGDENVVLVGETTVGKNVGSFPIYETDPVKQKTNTWGILPITFQMSNAERFSDYANGFVPDIEVSELDALEMKPLGDTDELMLNAALNAIFGIQTAARTRAGEKPHTVGSSADRFPARQNMYLDIRHKLSN